MFHGHQFGLYEKALDPGLTWAKRLASARRLGIDYVEISVDESDKRLLRLRWNRSRQRELLETVLDSQVAVRSMCLSAVRWKRITNAIPGG